MKVRSNVQISGNLSVDKNISHKIQALGNVSGSIEVDFSKGSQVSCTLVGTTTFTFSNYAAGSRYVFYINTGSYTLNLPVNVIEVKDFSYFTLDYDGTVFHSSSSVYDNLIYATYSELNSLKISNSLEVGQKYVLTDYYTKYVQPRSSKVKLCQYDDGTAFELSSIYEPLILTAVKTNAFTSTCTSLLHASDTVYYAFDNNLCENGVDSRNGFIFRRIDHVRNIDTYLDFRNIYLTRNSSNFYDFSYDLVWSEYKYVDDTCSNVLVEYSSNINDVIVRPTTHNVIIRSNCSELTVGTSNIEISSNISNYVSTISLTNNSNAIRLKANNYELQYYDEFSNLQFLNKTETYA